MLALVNPHHQHTPADVPLRPSSSSRSASSRSQGRKSSSSHSSSAPQPSSSSSAPSSSGHLLSQTDSHGSTPQPTHKLSRSSTNAATTSSYPTTATPHRSTSQSIPDPISQSHTSIPSHCLEPKAVSAPGILAPAAPKIDIHSYPTTELLKLLASLLTQIAAANDKLTPSEPAFPPPTSHCTSSSDPPVWRSLMEASRTSLANPSSSLTFHARNIPTISLESYFLRILKYCPTTNEVFLSLLVYFDRMSKLSAEATGRTFVIDSYNIHRLVIAGVTVASKFFSDVFYTNSRYAKVGGLPQLELNQLELQFLLLNDFNLAVSSDEMQRYADQLILFSRSEATMQPSQASDIPEVSGPTRAMGAFDAYGGRIANQPVHQPSSGQAHHQSCFRGKDEEDDDASVASAETETEGGDTTDDEPTIRPTCRDSEDDSRSMCSTSTTESDDWGSEREHSGRASIDHSKEEGESTPEQFATPGKERMDHRMASP